MECVAYMRVSTEKQAEEGNGLDSQKRDILSYAGKNEFVIKEWYIDDGYTGSNMERPALKRLINDCYNKKIKYIVAFKLDRISRSMIDGLYIIEKIFMPNGVTLKCVHDNIAYDDPMQQAYTQMMAVFTQLDKNTMLLRMRGGMLERVKQGYWMGGGNTPYCYRYSKETGTLMQIPERVEQARYAWKLFMEGWSDERIYKFLGFKSEFVVRQVLTSVVNIGKILYKGEIYQGLHEPVFTQEEYDMAQKLRANRRKKKYVQRNPNLLTGLCYCGVCGCAMRYQKWGNGIRKIYCCSKNKNLDYLPNHNPNCNNTYELAEDIEKQVEEKILEISLNITLDDLSGKVDKAEILQNKLISIKNKLKRLYEKYADGNDAVAELISELEAESKEVKAELLNIENEKLSNYNKKQQLNEIKKIADVWGNISKEDKNKVLKSIIDKIFLVNKDIEIILKNY